ncbi:hypothetical protein [uncultured Nonlabens sp.]|uniref:hypothetical protein n=1 Tax=uncultured Nonlabens sp. TaxID=859306 RepID=UPI0030D90492
MNDYAAPSDYIGNDNVTIHENVTRYDSSNGYKMFLRFYFTAKKVVADNCRTYYNVKRRGYVAFTDVHRVHNNGKRIILEMNSKGYANKVKIPPESWTEMIKNKSDFSITVEDDEKPEEIL